MTRLLKLTTAISSHTRVSFLAGLLLASVVPAQGQNLLNNPGFEQTLILWTARGSESLGRTNAAHTGNAAVLVTQRTADWHGIRQSVLGKVQPGVKYVCSGWARVDSTNAEPLKLSVEIEDDDGPRSLDVAEGVSGAGAWTYLSGTFTLQVTGALQKADLCLSGPAAGLDFSADDLVLIPTGGLRALADGVSVGGIMSYPTFPNEPVFARVTGREYDIAGTENALKFSDIHPSSTAYSFTAADTIVNAAMTNGQRARGHNLLWNSALPSWLTGGGYTPAQLQTILFSHIDTVVGRYKDKLFCWDVVNEALNPDGTMRDAFWYNQPGFGYAGQGTRYIEEAFKRARGADADAELFYNDYSIETLNTKSDAAYAMAQDFRNRGVPLDGIGFQMHVSLGQPNISSWRSNLQRFNDLGMKLHITEMDVRLPVDATGVATAANLAAQADIYFNVIGAALAFPNFQVLQTWGFTDLHSWIPGFYPGFGAALPLDRNYNRKPAWWAIRDVLANQAELLPVTDLSPGDSQLLVTNTFFSGGRARQFLANGPNAFITFAMEVPYSGPYNVRVGVRRSNAGGQFQFATQPTGGSNFNPIGSAQDTYAAATAYVELDLGTASFDTNGFYDFRFLVTGKNVSSGGYGLVLDYLRLTPTGTEGNQPPSISGTADVVMQNSGAPLLIPFNVSDRETVETALTTTVTSSNTTLLPNGNIVVLGAGQNRILSLTPVANQFGTTSLTTVVVDADGMGSTNRFNLIVNPPPPQVLIADKANNIELTWPSNAVAWHLESAATLASGTLWQQVTNAPAFTNQSWSVTIPKTETSSFFRLAQ